jgi:deoxyribodipyrimidine photolyase
MYWAKQIIGWTPDAETALDYCIRLNNRWELDAVDPNSYAGIIWNFGRHDQGWKEREIWGKVRYMNEAGLKRKFNMAAYISKVELLVRKVGLPDRIGHLRQSRQSGLKGLVQTTLDETPAQATSSPLGGRELPQLWPSTQGIIHNLRGDNCFSSNSTS